MKQMKKVVMIALFSAVFMVGCTRTCKIEGCKNEVYKEGLCQTHYYVNQGADAIGNAVNGIMNILK